MDPCTSRHPVRTRTPEDQPESTDQTQRGTGTYGTVPTIEFKQYCEWDGFSLGLETKAAVTACRVKISISKTYRFCTHDAQVFSTGIVL